ncbi:TetR/AcrR family transcriptional regulator [soil metagenome]
MGVAERREREREQLRWQIVDAARDLLLEEGLNGLSMRAIAERIEYSPATIYLYFKDKDELVRDVVRTGFERLGEVVTAELQRAGETAGAAEQYSSMGRAYARFAVENPSYFRVMFELPSTAELECREVDEDEPHGFDTAVRMVQRAVETGEFGALDPRRTAVVGWSVIHGLTTLYLSGHLGGDAQTPEEFYELVEYAISSLYTGWKPAAGGEGAS